MTLRLFTHILLSLMLLVTATVSQARGMCSENAVQAVSQVSEMPCHQSMAAADDVPDHSHVNCLCCSGAVGAAVSVSVIADRLTGPDAFVLRTVPVRTDSAHRTPIQRPPIS